MGEVLPRGPQSLGKHVLSRSRRLRLNTFTVLGFQPLVEVLPCTATGGETGTSTGRQTADRRWLLRSVGGFVVGGDPLVDVLGMLGVVIQNGRHLDGRQPSDDAKLATQALPLPRRIFVVDGMHGDDDFPDVWTVEQCRARAGGSLPNDDSGMLPAIDCVGGCGNGCRTDRCRRFNGGPIGLSAHPS